MLEGKHDQRRINVTYQRGQAVHEFPLVVVRHQQLNLSETPRTEKTVVERLSGKRERRFKYTLDLYGPVPGHALE